ncbi:MAG: PIN domain-containing protein [Propionibacteriaceae bacterium]|jgi:toxin-antitoxin system PIN domain toxin|nr:PIN domain-containing protein [Propionibacteriaceae bacterium]
MRSLLDVNVLIALFDADHVFHQRAWEWFDGAIDEGWASCAITQNGYLRIVSSPRYPGAHITANEALGLLRGATTDAHHEFWPCDVSLIDSDKVDSTRAFTSSQVTDMYLLALAVTHQGRFVTFDQHIALSQVRRATPENLVVL